MERTRCGWTVGFFLFLCASLGARDTAEVVADFSKAFQRSSKDPKSAGAWHDAVENIRGHDFPEVAEAVVQAYARLEKEAEPIEKKRQRERLKGSRGQVVELRDALDPIRKAQENLENLIAELRQPNTLVWLFDNVMGSEDFPLSLKLFLARNTAKLGNKAGPPLVAGVKKAKRPEEYTVLLRGIASIGPAAMDAGDDIIKLLKHKEPPVREHAALALSAIAVPQSIEPLIEALAREESYTQRTMASALEVITRKKLGVTIAAWRDWFKDEGLTYTSGTVPLGGGETSDAPDQAEGYFVGIPQIGHSIVYVVDVSGSMVLSMTDPKYQGRRRPIPAPPGESRMDLLRGELKAALQALPKGTLFNIVYYSFTADLYAPKMLTASDSTIKKVCKWVDSLKPDGATNIYDAMEAAFGLAGKTPYDEYYDTRVETIFLLTDGEPQLPNGRDDSTERIVAGVRKWNPYKRVVIHTVALGKKTNKDFLRQIAEENGGVFVER